MVISLRNQDGHLLATIDRSYFVRGSNSSLSLVSQQHQKKTTGNLIYSAAPIF